MNKVGVPGIVPVDASAQKNELGIPVIDFQFIRDGKVSEEASHLIFGFGDQVPYMLSDEFGQHCKVIIQEKEYGLTEIAGSNASAGYLNSEIIIEGGKVKHTVSGDIYTQRSIQTEPSQCSVYDQYINKDIDVNFLMDLEFEKVGKKRKHDWGKIPAKALIPVGSIIIDDLLISIDAAESLLKNNNREYKVVTNDKGQVLRTQFGFVYRLVQ